VILKCLEREPAARFQDAQEVADALRGETRHIGRWSFEPRVVLAALALVLAIVVGAVLIPGIRHRAPAANGIAATIQSMTVRPSVAVLPLRNLSGGRIQTGCRQPCPRC
jgi:hypothetical protein